MLTLEFSVGVDPGSVDPDTVQIVGSDGLPVLGLYEVAGNIVRFNPVVDENASNPHAVPLNPYGFESGMAFAVVLPGPETRPIKVLSSIHGRPLAGSFTGPFLGISFSLIAVAHTKIGIAATLMATVPIMMLPLVKVIHNEHLSAKAIGGAIIAVAGVAILFI